MNNKAKKMYRSNRKITRRNCVSFHILHKFQQLPPLMGHYLYNFKNLGSSINIK